MMTIASIDTLPETTTLDAAATPVTAISAETVGAFQQALSGQLTENENLGSVLREAITNVGATLAKVEVARIESPSVSQATPESVTVQPLSVQVKENVALDETLQAEKVIVENLLPQIEIKIASKVVEQPTVTPAAAAPVVVQPLPAQVSENVKLGEMLMTATVVVGETLANVESAVTQTATVRPDVRIDAPVAVAPAVVQSVAQAMEPVAAQPVAGQTAESVTVQPLPVLVTENVKLGETLTESKVIVAETEAMVDAVVLGGPRSEYSEVNAEALVAAGAVPQVPVQPPVAVEAPRAEVSVTPVDVVRVQSAAAAETVPSQVLVQAAEAVADTLLVTPGLLRGQGEVVVQLRPDVLDGTEVKIAVTGRQLEIVFQPHTVDMAVMIESCRTQLVQHLAAKIVSFNVSVDVRKRKS